MLPKIHAKDKYHETSSNTDTSWYEFVFDIFHLKITYEFLSEKTLRQLCFLSGNHTNHVSARSISLRCAQASGLSHFLRFGDPYEFSPTPLFENPEIMAHFCTHETNGTFWNFLGSPNINHTIVAEGICLYSCS